MHINRLGTAGAIGSEKTYLNSVKMLRERVRVSIYQL